jgi:GNAT superfamily N-acetyltransferase
MFTLEPATVEDFDRLLQLRLRCMRESLERIGRFDEWRAYDRFRNSYRPHYTRLIMRPQGELAGCVAMGPADGDLLLEHFYIAPEQQGKGLGSAVLQRLLGEADAAGLPIRLSVLQQSDAGRFYARHGFTQTGEDEWDVYYRRPPQTSGEPARGVGGQPMEKQLR